MAWTRDDYSDQIRRKTIAEVDARQYADASFPECNPDQNTWLILAHNTPDGIGDFQHFIDYILSLETVASKNGYIVEGVLNLHLDNCNASNLILKQLGSLENVKLNMTCSLIEGNITALLEGLKQLPHVTLHEDPDTLLKAISPLKKIAVCFEIHSGRNRFEFLTNTLPDNAMMVVINEYGVRDRPPKTKNPFMFASMGLGSRNAYGLKITPQEKLSFDEKVRTLQRFENKTLSAALLPTFEKNELFIGYMQSPGAALGYILTSMQMKTPPDGSPAKNCDFFLDKKSIDKEPSVGGQNYMGVMNNKIQEKFGPCTVSFITQNRETGELVKIKYGEGERVVRVFYGIPLSNDDYRAMRLISDNPGGCTGDSSFSDVVSSHELFFFGNYRRHQFIIRFPDQLIKFLEKTNYKNQFPKLYNYAQALEGTTYDSDIAELLTDSKVERIDKTLKKSIEESPLMIGELLQDPELQIQWEGFRGILVANYNYYDHLSNIAKTAMIWQNNPEEAERLSQENQGKRDTPRP